MKLKFPNGSSIEFGPVDEGEELKGGNWDYIYMEPEPILELSIQEVKDLQKFLYDSGYISHEFHEPIHELSRKIDKFLKDIENESKRI